MIEHAIVRAELAIAHVEGLVIDEQADELAIRHVDDGLARLRRSVLGLGLRESVRKVMGSRFARPPL
jgi:hypothetical protein